jgi:hypothetical protein
MGIVRNKLPALLGHDLRVLKSVRHMSFGDRQSFHHDGICLRDRAPLPQNRRQPGQSANPDATADRERRKFGGSGRGEVRGLRGSKIAQVFLEVAE